MKNDDVDLFFSSFIILNWVESDMMEEDSFDPIIKILYSPTVWTWSGLQGQEGIQHVDMGGEAVRPGPCPPSPLPRPRGRARRGAGQLMRTVGRGTVGPRSRHHPHQPVPTWHGGTDGKSDQLSIA